MPLRTILIGLDSSAYSLNAIELGIGWAKRRRATLIGLAVVDEPGLTAPEPIPLGAGHFKHELNRARVAKARREVRIRLDAFAARCRRAKVECRVLRGAGVPYAQILDQAQRVDLVMLGQQTYFSPAAGAEGGDTLRRVVEHASRPVVVVPDPLRQGPAVVLAYDGSVPAGRALYAFVASGLGAGLRVHVLSVRSRKAEAARLAAAARAFLDYHGITASVRAIAAAASPAEVLLDQTVSLHAGLIVMGAHGKSWLQAFLLGSVTRAMLERAKVPLFLSS
ncbi:MAG TPA: universal stress protein [Methylomirabilota bacterium]|nr:universal stress protein [Methylomirabilota bacterium]